MVRIGLLALGLGVFSFVAYSQEDPLAWFPLQVGSRWVYEHEWKSGDRNRPDVERWTSEMTVTGSVAVAEGLILLREVKQQGSASPKTIGVIAPNGERRSILQPVARGGAVAARDRQPYLIHGNCLYVISAGWDGQRQQLRPEYRKYLSEGALSPDFCFPLQTGRAWGNHDIPWRVEPARPGIGSFLPGEYGGAIHIFSGHFGSGGWDDVWFQKGVGVVGEHYLHNGTYDEYTKKLLSYLP